MTWKNEQSPCSNPPSTTKPNIDGAFHLLKARNSLVQLLDDSRLSAAARARLAEDYQHLQRFLGKIEQGTIHVATFGRVGVGKSTLLNALSGKNVFLTSVLHGQTQRSEEVLWENAGDGIVFLIDTPGIDEIHGQEHALIAQTVAQNADIILFVIDSDMTDIELSALQQLHHQTQPIILVINKSDQLSAKEALKLQKHIRWRVAEMIPPERVVMTASRPDEELIVKERENGNVEEIWQTRAVDIAELQKVLQDLIAQFGRSYVALNASVFASRLSDKVVAEVMAVKQNVAEHVIRQYALFKAVGVAINPLPAVDLLALAADSGMVVHLAQIYGFSLTRREAGALMRTIALQTGLLIGTVYGVQILSSTLKGLTAGLSTVLTAGTQAGLAFYGSYVVGKAAQKYFAAGASWGEGGAKRVIEDIIADLDKEALMMEAKNSIRQILGKEQHD
ncbi:YcjF family protein [Dichelobacter nodosus]|nr:GTP-binding protein [Dichelobacter nodosus]KNZ39821.1 GTP-binding protein [Dichelobacter nodosus]